MVSPTVHSTRLNRPIVIVGAGAVGTSLAVLLTHAGHEVVVIVRRPDVAERGATLSELPRGREVAVQNLDLRDLSGVPPRPHAVFVCARGDQVRSALAALAGKVDPACPLVVPGVTFDDLDELARQCGLPSPPMVRLAVGFGVWKQGPGRYELFSLSPFGSALAPESSAPRALCRDLARILSGAGLPTRAVPPALFHASLRLFNGLQLPFLLAWGRAGWDLRRLRGDRALLSICAAGMWEVSRAVRARTGPLGWVVSFLPRWGFALLARAATRLAGTRLSELFVHHGPKLAAQLRFNAAQLGDIARGRGVDDRALRALAE